jgi:hypothetical protein
MYKIDPDIIARLKIEKGVSVEPKKEKRTTGMQSLVSRMRISDSVVVPDQYYAKRLAATISNCGFTSKQKKQTDGQVRVWKFSKAKHNTASELHY